MNMTKIKDILSIRLEDDIKSVIDLNQQDESSIMDELDGFILTAHQTQPNQDCG